MFSLIINTIGGIFCVMSIIILIAEIIDGITAKELKIDQRLFGLFIIASMLFFIYNNWR